MKKFHLPEKIKLKHFIVPVFILTLTSCIPNNRIELRDIKNIALEQLDNDNAILNGDAVFFNPNSTRMRLKEINVEVFVDGKKSALVDQKLSALARGNSEFTVPVKVQLSLKEFGLMDAIRSLFGGKKYEIHYKGYLKANVNGWPIRVPVDHKEDFKLRM